MAVGPGWLSRSEADVPPGDDWLTPAEREVQSGLRRPWRRADWRLGRWTAKCAVGAWLAIPPARVEILAAPDGAPEAWLGGERAPVSISLSHRAGRALAAVLDLPAVVGCDLELVEPRSAGFLDEWLSAGERELVAAAPAPGRALLANLAWSAKEAVAKVRREGLRLDVRDADVEPGGAASAPVGGWRPLRVAWDGAVTQGWWLPDGGFVLTLAARPDPGRPFSLEH